MFLFLLFLPGGAVINENAYIYDKAHMRTQETVTNGNLFSAPAKFASYSYNNINQLTNTGNAYDADGNMTSFITPGGYAATASYDAENRLSTVSYRDASNVNHTTTFTYNADDMLVKQVVDGVETRFVRDTNFNVLQERDGSNNLVRSYVWDENSPGGIGGLLELTTNGQHYDYLCDGKGNVSAVIDSNQQVVAAYKYDGFGKLLSKTGTLDQPYQFSTKPYYPALGLNYYGYRFYNSVLGKWMTRDPLEEWSDINLYRGVGNNTINFMDPHGDVLPIIIGAVAIGGVANGLNEAYTAYRANEPLMDIVEAFGRGGVAGMAGVVAGIATAVATKNPMLVGAYASLSASMANEYLKGWNNDSAANVCTSTAAGAALGPIVNKIPMLKTKGRMPNIFKPRSIDLYGKNSMRILGREATSGILNPVGEGAIRGTVQSINNSNMKNTLFNSQQLNPWYEYEGY